MKSLLDVKKVENRLRARFEEAFALQRRISCANVFLTFSPDTASTILICINTSAINEFNIKFGIPGRGERKLIAGDNAVECAKYAKKLSDVFIHDFLGWDTLKHMSLEGGGALGVIRWFAGAAEAQKCHDVHFHFVIGVHGIPRTTKEFTTKLQEIAFQEK